MQVLLMFGAQMLHGFFYGITIPLLWAMIADVADYSEWKNYRRATAIIFSHDGNLKADCQLAEHLFRGL